MNHQLLAGHKLRNMTHSALLLLGMALLTGVLGWLLLGATGLLLALAFTILASALAPSVPPRALLRLYGARPLARPDAPVLFDIMEELARRAGLPWTPSLHYIPNPAPNAFSLGGRGQAAVAVTDGLLRLLTPARTDGRAGP